MPVPRAEWGHRAVAIPAAWAGSFFLLACLLATQQTMPGDTIPVELPSIEFVLGLFAAAALASIFGMLLSAIPILGGVAFMATVGRWSPGLRHPAIWALAGAAMCAGAVLGPGGGADSPPALALVFTGAACAALARRYVHWPEFEE
ncbi:hypothetical protein [Sphingomonas hengshuiensis]|uniref:Uncharacterized protein n=1 Tax=Sphingomonas hengshuiensis TaxID=1609977 RepID=A0A7U4J768_9SPHN|nr:hypothetical protein [Sphingomonas hengshuiensis]AJP71508.1 hypothetical protein TS85_06555 [Sphingomonas hengshuiensis]